nr:LRR receptor-like serine/threonine-protein kinase IOS1 [Ziziphus jujuba var. spinosa]
MQTNCKEDYKAVNHGISFVQELKSPSSTQGLMPLYLSNSLQERAIDQYPQSGSTSQLYLVDQQLSLMDNQHPDLALQLFGIVLVATITSQPAISRRQERTHMSQGVSYAVGDGDIRSVVDSRLEGDFEVNSMWKAVEIAMACVSPTSFQRLNMNQVVTQLKDCSVIEVARKNHISLTHATAANSDEKYYVASSIELINPFPR